MRLVVFCLLAVCCYSLASAARNRRNTVRKLQEVLREIKEAKESRQHSDHALIGTPPQDLEEGCCGPVLDCFRNNLQLYFNMTHKEKKLHKSLKSPSTTNGMAFCKTENATPTCQNCTSYPMESATVFYERLRSLIQRALVESMQ